jgi:hypothetical protein
MEEVPLGLASWERTMRAIEKVKERLLITTAALERAGVPYAVSGDFAAAAWVARVDESAVRTCATVEVLVRRAEFAAVEAALGSVGFVRRRPGPTDRRSLVVFVNEPGAQVRDGVFMIFAGEPLLGENPLPSPDVSEAEIIEGRRVLSLDALVRMELATNKALQGMRLCDLMDVGLIDASWRDRVPPELQVRLQEILDNPEG